MMNLIKQAAFDLHNESITKWKKNNHPVVGYTCSQVPVELFYAGGILPVRLRGVGIQGLDIADAYYGPFICSFPKAILQSMAAKKLTHLDGAVIADGCDSMRRLDECWRRASNDYPHMRMPFFHYMNIPRKVADHAREWFIYELQKLQTVLSSHFNVTITMERIEQSIEQYNQSRKLIEQIEALRKLTPPGISGSDAFSISLAAESMAPETFQKEVSAAYKELSTQPAQNPDGPRILISGSAYDDIHLIQTIESAGANVVGENVCFGPSHRMNQVSEKLPPLEALMEHYLLTCPCPRMFGRFDYRLNLLKEQIQNVQAKGVVLQNIRFCDLHASENGLLEPKLEKEGIPCIRLEREYGSQTDTGRLRMRIDAFLERIS
jgi:benzoyl-CoA reductase/2-hydroxyglutaryl-CoA dehydratase subunit BcrC/BadD/HgdB